MKSTRRDNASIFPVFFDTLAPYVETDDTFRSATAVGEVTYRSSTKMNVDKDFIERLLRDAVVALSLPAVEQCRVLSPGCVSCELLNDFDHAYRCYAQSCADRLTPERSHVLAEIDKTMRSMSEADYVCYEPSALDRPVWDELRHLATQALSLFAWQDHAINPHKETQPGVWQRANGTSAIVGAEHDQSHRAQQNE